MLGGAKISPGSAKDRQEKKFDYSLLYYHRPNSGL
jgi:hypothetical protein